MLLLGGIFMVRLEGFAFATSIISSPLKLVRIREVTKMP